MFPSTLPALPTSHSAFTPLRQAGAMYIDKTGPLVDLLAPISSASDMLRNQYVFFARPRRFGKTMLVATLEAWFQGDLPRLPVSQADANRAMEQDLLFQNTALGQSNLQRDFHPVIRLNLARLPTNTPDAMARGLRRRLGLQYMAWHDRGVPVALSPHSPGGIELPVLQAGGMEPSEYLEELIVALEHHYGVQPVVLIDEYDAPVTDLLNKDVAYDPYTDMLRDFFGMLKVCGDSLHFVFITGISRFAMVNLFSALNNLVDLSWNPVYATLCGFTESEIKTCLHPWLEAGATGLGQTVDEVMQGLRDYYNGYCFGVPGDADVYNPFSLICCLQDLYVWYQTGSKGNWHWPNYWAESGTPDILVQMVRQNPLLLTQTPPAAGLKTRSYRLDNPDYATLMLHTGYYTLREGDGKREILDYPNQEVYKTYMESLLEACYAIPDPSVQLEFYRYLEGGHYQAFAQLLTSFLGSYPGEKITRETDVHLILLSLCKIMQLDFRTEEHTIGGRLDISMFFPRHICLMELKYNATAREALDQIIRKKYGLQYANDPRPVTAVGLNFNHRTSDGNIVVECLQQELYPALNTKAENQDDSRVEGDR